MSLCFIVDNIFVLGYVDTASKMLVFLYSLLCKWKSDILHGVTETVQQIPSWEVTSHRASQEISYIWYKLKVINHIHKGQPLDPIHSLKNPIHILRPYFLTFHSTLSSIYA
jgi:hypothetical protein